MKTLKGSISRIGSTVCVMVRVSGVPGGYIATGATVPQAFQKLSLAMQLDI